MHLHLFLLAIRTGKMPQPGFPSTKLASVCHKDSVLKTIMLPATRRDVGELLYIVHIQYFMEAINELVKVNAFLILRMSLDSKI